MNIIFQLILYLQMTIGIINGAFIVVLYNNAFLGLSVICMGIVGIGLNYLYHDSLKKQKG